MSSISPVEASLAEVEVLLAKVGEALQASQAEELQQASLQLRNAALRFSEVLEVHRALAQTPAIAVRVRTVAARLASQRDALARLSALTDRRAATLLPTQASSSTYGPGAGARQTGAARIYKATG